MTEAAEQNGNANGNGNGNGHGADPLQKRVEEGPKGGALTWYDVLEIPVEASAADVKKAYDRALALVEGRNIGGYLMLDPLAAESARADVEAAFQVLGDADRRSAYDARLREQGKAPAIAKGDETIPVRPASSLAGHDASDDREAREAKEILAVADAQTSSTPTGASRIPAPTATTSGLKFLAPVGDQEKSEKRPASPSASPAHESKESKESRAKRESVKEDPFEAKSTLPAIRFGEPKTEELGPVEEVSDVFQTLKPQPASDPAAPSASASASASSSVSSTSSTAPPSSASASSASASSASASSASSSGTAVSASGSFVASALPDGEITGQHIKELRENRGLSLEEMAEATKIRKNYLKAVEEHDFPNLPARVYLRGFLTQVARVLKVDRARLAEGYLQFVEKNAPKT